MSWSTGQEGDRSLAMVSCCVLKIGSVSSDLMSTAVHTVAEKQGVRKALS